MGWQQVQILCVIAISGALGALARYGTMLLAIRLWGDRFPYGTLIVNTLGCLAIGLAAAALPEPHDKTAAGWWLRHSLMIGFLGAYTTFSTFSLDTLMQLESGQALPAGLNVVANVALCLAATWIGLKIGQAAF